MRMRDPRPSKSVATKSEIYFDVETLRLSYEVDGGWSNIQAFGLAVAVTWDEQHGFRDWFEKDAKKLVAEMANFERIVTFNGNRFDFLVLRAYSPVDRLLPRSLDILELLHRQLGYRMKLDQLAHDTLGTQKAGDGLDAVRWWREGKRADVVKYCRKDVEILRDLVYHGRREGHVLLENIRVDVQWD
jgi:DEAD/DEAH box helicase domain-containing protein